MIDMPEEVLHIINKLNSRGFEAYIVGGCVRDEIIGTTPNDWDIATDANTDEITDLFEKVIPTGIKYGTLTIIMNSNSFEITTYRNAEKNNENPLLLDLSKRDFTINAIAYHPKIGFIDPFNGQKDINLKIIRCVEDADERFSEDPLRMLRAIRFSAQLGYKIEEKTYESIIKNNKMLSKVSSERIRDEFNKILIYNSNKIDLLIESGLMNSIVPEFLDCIGIEHNNPYHVYTVSEHILKSVQNIDNDLELKLTMVLHDIGKSKCKTIDEKGIGHFYGHPIISQKIALAILKRLKYDNKMINKVSTLILYHDSKIEENKKSIKKWLSKIGKENFKELLKVKLADESAKNPVCYDERLDKIKKIESIMNEILESGECFKIGDLDICGDELINMGYVSGKQIGEILKFLLDKVIENPKLNKNNCLKELVKNEYKIL
jgi:tRNA nucleotidyltransferase (CCA-adding enzyme)